MLWPPFVVIGFFSAEAARFPFPFQMPRPSFNRRPSSTPAPKPPPSGSESWARPWAVMKYYSYHPAFYPNMVGAVSSDAGPGDLVNVYDKEGRLILMMPQILVFWL